MFRERFEIRALIRFWSAGQTAVTACAMDDLSPDRTSSTFIDSFTCVRGANRFWSSTWNLAAPKSVFRSDRSRCGVRGVLRIAFKCRRSADGGMTSAFVEDDHRCRRESRRLAMRCSPSARSDGTNQCTQHYISTANLYSICYAM